MAVASGQHGIAARLPSTGTWVARWIHTLALCLGWLALCTNSAWAQTATSTTLASSVNPAVVEQITTPTATVTPAAATGTVTLKDALFLLTNSQGLET